MKLKHERDAIRAVRKYWLSQYAGRDSREKLGWDHSRTFGDVRAALKGLDLETCSHEDVDAALGVKGWSRQTCDECGQNSALLMHFGEEPDYDAKWQYLCLGCLEGAVEEMRQCVVVP